MHAPHSKIPSLIFAAQLFTCTMAFDDEIVDSATEVESAVIDCDVRSSAFGVVVIVVVVVGGVKRRRWCVTDGRTDERGCGRLRELVAGRLVGIDEVAVTYESRVGKK
jgi:hypothetical protein